MTGEFTKLAELLKEALRRHDVGAGCHVVSDGILLWEPRAIGGHGRLLGKRSTRLTVPQASAAILRIFSLPKGTMAEDVVKALEVQS